MKAEVAVKVLDKMLEQTGKHKQFLLLVPGGHQAPGVREKRRKGEMVLAPKAACDREGTNSLCHFGPSLQVHFPISHCPGLELTEGFAEVISL